MINPEKLEWDRQRLALSLEHAKEGHVIKSKALQIQILEGYLELIAASTDLKAKFDRAVSCR